MTAHGVKTVDLRDHLGSDQTKRLQFVQDLGSSITECGFVIVENHGIPSSQLQAAYRAAESFFSLPLESKKTYEVPGGMGQRGYTSFGREHAKNQTAGDLKEFWHVGREDATRQTYPPNLWPNHEIPEFKPSMHALYQALDSLAERLLGALEGYLKLGDGTLSAMAHEGNSILRVLHYPPLDASRAIPGAVRAAAHEDINLITLLCGATDSGLEILGRSGEWIPIVSRPDQIVVDSGDMLSRVTNGLVPSTTHRVVNPSGDAASRSRYSMPFFVHPYPDCDLSVLKECTSPDFPPRFPPCRADEFLRQRLAEIGLTGQ
jgi:isopenicillin N synthase-like dioxygenase